MLIESISLDRFRNLQSVELRFSPQLNLFVGDNAAGKTSLLEALYVLGRGRSFRSARLERLIQNDQSDFQLVARLAATDGRHLPLGMRYSKGRFECRLDGRPIKRLSELAALLPVQWLGGNLHSLVEEGPAYRRQFLDWGLFHVEPEYVLVCKRFNRLLRQRNAVLRAAGSRREVRAWNGELAEAGEQLDVERRRYFAALVNGFERLNREAPILDAPIGLVYARGWSQEASYLDVLNDGYEKDLDSRYTRSGPQRAELRFTVDGKSAAERLSRGQQKHLITALQLAQATVLKEETGKSSLFLFDDLGAELDASRQRTVLDLLSRIGAQVFVTAIEEPAGVDWSNYSYSRFHVERGMIFEVL
jgi:DNA replication and repair protein RecF